MIHIWLIAIVFAIISLFTTDPAPLIAGFIMIIIGLIAQEIYK